MSDDKPIPAQPPTHFVGGFGVWLNHRTMAEVMAEERFEQASQRSAMQRTCPKCGSAPGVRCKSPSGWPSEGVHLDRRAA